MLLCDFSFAYVDAAVVLHKTSFDFPWDAKAFQNLLLLPTTIGWISEWGLLVCSAVLDEMEVLTICVHPDFRRQGRADLLLSHLMQEARKRCIHRIFLEVSAQNKPAIALYEKNGFLRSGIRRNYYRTTEGFCDAFCYCKTLD